MLLNSNTLSHWRNRCHVSWVKLTNCKGNINLNFRLAGDEVGRLETAVNLLC